MSKQQTETLTVGQTILAPTDHGTRLDWRTITEIEMSSHGEYALDFTEGPVLIAEAWDEWPVLEADTDPADEAAAATRTEHQHAWITLTDEDGEPLYRECVERGCTARECAEPGCPVHGRRAEAVAR